MASRVALWQEDFILIVPSMAALLGKNQGWLVKVVAVAIFGFESGLWPTTGSRVIKNNEPFILFISFIFYFFFSNNLKFGFHLQYMPNLLNQLIYVRLTWGHMINQNVGFERCGSKQKLSRSLCVSAWRHLQSVAHHLCLILHHKSFLYIKKKKKVPVAYLITVRIFFLHRISSSG